MITGLGLFLLDLMDPAPVPGHIEAEILTNAARGLSARNRAGARGFLVFPCCVPGRGDAARWTPATHSVSGAAASRRSTHLAPSALLSDRGACDGSSQTATGLYGSVALFGEGDVP